MNMYIVLNVILIILCFLYMGLEPYMAMGHRKYIYWLLVIVASVLFAFRPDETKDTLGYIEGFHQAGDLSGVEFSFVSKYDGYEMGYIYLMNLFKRLFNNYRLFFWFISFSGLTLTLYSLTRLVEKYLIDEQHDILGIVLVPYGRILAIYMASYGFLYHGISVRAGFSMGLALFSITSLIDKKLLRALLFAMMSLLIQRMSILILIAYLIYRYLPAIERKTHLIIWACTGILMFSGATYTVLSFIITRLMNLINRFRISGYAAYLTTLDAGVGLIDIYKWLLYGFLALVSDRSKTMQRYLNVVMVGAIIVVFMHDVRSVSRAYDLFYVFSIPMLTIISMDKLSNYNAVRGFEKLINLVIVSVSALIMLKTSFI